VRAGDGAEPGTKELRADAPLPTLPDGEGERWGGSLAASSKASFQRAITGHSISNGSQGCAEAREGVGWIGGREEGWDARQLESADSLHTTESQFIFDSAN